MFEYLCDAQWVPVVGMLINCVGLGFNITGVFKMFNNPPPIVTDTLDILSEIHNSSYAVIAPPLGETTSRQDKQMQNIKETKDKIIDYEKRNKHALIFILIGFVIQLIGTLIWGLF